MPLGQTSPRKKAEAPIGNSNHWPNSQWSGLPKRPLKPRTTALAKKKSISWEYYEASLKSSLLGLIIQAYIINITISPKRNHAILYI